jgi:hypothetical protein
VRQAAIRRKIQDVQSRIVALRLEIGVLDEQVEAFDEDAEEHRVRAVVSETPLAAREHAEASRHAEIAHRARTTAAETLVKLEATRDGLLEQLSVEAVS